MWHSDKIQRHLETTIKHKLGGVKHLQAAESFSFPEQTLDPVRLQRESQLSIPKGVSILLQPLEAQGTISKQPETTPPHPNVNDRSLELLTLQEECMLSLELHGVVSNGISEAFDGQLKLSGGR